MKKIYTLFLAAVMAFTLTACGSAGIPEVPDETPETAPLETQRSYLSSENKDLQSATVESDNTNILVAYFSRTGENYNVGVIEKGNTEIVAEMIAGQTGGDLFRMETVTPYPENYRECTDVAQQEFRDNARPELTAAVNNFDNYEVIFLGYPIWWSDMPMAVYTFLENYDFTGKTIVPFATHEGSGLASTESSIAGACSGAEVLDGLAIRGSVAQNSQEEAEDAVVSWLRDGGFID